MTQEQPAKKERFQTVYVLESPLYEPSSDTDFAGRVWLAMSPLELDYLLRWNDSVEVHNGLWTEVSCTYSIISFDEYLSLPEEMRADIGIEHGSFGEFLETHRTDTMYEKAYADWLKD